MKKLQKSIVLIGILLIALEMTGCKPNVEPENNIPVITTDLPASLPLKVNVSHEFTIVATDADNDPLTYTWQESSDNGTSWTNVGSNSSTYSFSKASTGTWKLRSTVSDDMGGVVTSTVCTIPVTATPVFNASLEISIIKATGPGEVKFTTSGSYSEGSISLAELYYTNADGTPNPSTPFASIANPTLPWDKTMADIPNGSYVVRAKLTGSDNMTQWSDTKMFTISQTPVNTYTVTFDSNGGTAVSPITGVVSGTKITKPTDPTKSGFTFEGWFKEAGLTNQWSFSTDTVTSNITLYAKWTAIPPATYTVTFDSNGGTAVSPITGVVSGTKITKPTDPTKSGFTFEGWFKEAGLTNQWSFSTDTVTSNITLYAKWTENMTGNVEDGNGVLKYTVSNPSTVKFFSAYSADPSAHRVFRENGNVEDGNGVLKYTVSNPSTVKFFSIYGTDPSAHRVFRENGNVEDGNGVLKYTVSNPSTVKFFSAYSADSSAHRVFRENGNVEDGNGVLKYTVSNPSTVKFFSIYGTDPSAHRLMR